MKIPANDFSYPPVGLRGRKLRLWASLFIVLALLTLVITFYQISKRQKWFAPYLTYYSYLDHSQSIQVGDPVYLMGFKIGYVYKIDVGSSEAGHERQLVLIYKVLRGYRYYINEDSVLQIQRFIPGTAKLELTKGQIDPATGLPLSPHKTSEPIPVVLGSTLGGVADKFMEVLDKIQNPNGSIGKMLATPEVHDQLVKFLGSMSGTLDATSSLVSHLDRDLTGEQGELKKTLKEIGASLETARTFIEGLKHHWLFRSAFEKKDPNEKPESTKGSFSPAPAPSDNKPAGGSNKTPPQNSR